jgi:undecaprenyl-diphosphatase
MTSDPHRTRSDPFRGHAPSWPSALAGLAGRLALGWTVTLVVMVGLGALVTVGLAHMWPLTVEDGIDRSLEAARTATGNQATLWMSGLGQTTTIVPLALAAFVGLRLALHRWREALFVGAVTIGQSLVFLLTTLVIDRDRPDVEHLDASPPTSSFPSGHTGASLALYLSLAVVVHRRVRHPALRRVLIAVLALLPLLVGLARLYRGMHHPSDVAGSAVNAGLVLWTGDRAMRATQLPDDDRPTPGPARSGMSTTPHPREVRP